MDKVCHSIRIIPHYFGSFQIERCPKCFGVLIIFTRYGFKRGDLKPGAPARSRASTERQRFGPESESDWGTAVGRRDRGLDFSFFGFVLSSSGFGVFVFSSVCVRVRGSQSGLCQTLLPSFFFPPPDPNHRQRGSFALNSVASA